MSIESCAATFPNRELVRGVDPAASFIGNREDLCDVTDDSLRRICVPVEMESNFRSVIDANRNIASTLGDKVKIVLVEEREGMLFADIPLQAVGAGALRDDYPGSGRGARLIEAINQFTQGVPHTRELICHCWGVDPEGDVPFIFIPFGNRE